MSKIAVIFESSPFDRKGLFNAVHNRVKRLSASGKFDVDVFCIHSRDTAFTRKVRMTPDVPDVGSVTIDGIDYRLLWYDFSITDHILVEKLHREPFFFRRFINAISPAFADYGLVISHSFTGALVAYELKMRYGIPYFANWHGSDVHTHPRRNPLIFRRTAEVMDAAEYNFFVSKALMSGSESISSSARKAVLYNGVSDDFMVLTPSERLAARMKYGLDEADKVVAYVGSLSRVKNVMSLHPIFNKVRAAYPGSVRFLVAGDGKMRSAVEPALMADASIDVRMLGNIPSGDVPELMNCVDVLVLPSLNEGLGMVAAEAIACGADVVGSDVGGIPEIIGSAFSVPHGEGFEERFAGKVVECLRTPARQSLPPEISWERTCGIEAGYISDIIGV